MQGYIRSIIPFSLVDGPGNRTAIFLQGCNFDCLYCHNPETIPTMTAQRQLENVKCLTPEELVEAIEAYFPFISGVTFSGGECTLQAPFVEAVCRLLKAKGQHILIDTNGHMPLEAFKSLAEVVDGFMFDIKAILEEDHLRLTGALNRRVLQHLEQAAALGKLYEVRTVVLPVLVDNEATVKWVADFIAAYAPTCRYKLIAYRPHGVRTGHLTGIDPPTESVMTALETLARAHGVQDVIRI